MTSGRVPWLHAVTDDSVLARSDFLDQARRVLAAGGAGMALHVRGPHTSGLRLFECARALLPAARGAGATLLVNDRVDVALATGTDGVHLGARSLPPPRVRALVGSGRLVGVSVHDPEAAARAEEDGADYLLVGTIFPSTSHPEAPAAGPGLLKEIARLSSLPLVAIGGVTPARVAEVRAAGGTGVAAIGAVWGGPDPGAGVRGFFRVWEGRR